MTLPLIYICFPSQIHLKLKAISVILQIYTTYIEMKRYSRQSEVRFKVTDQQAEIFRDTAWYLYESHMLDKPNIQSFGRWCMNYVCRLYGGGVIQSKVIRQQKLQQQMWQKQQLSSLRTSG
jgi:hypothetical protein